MIYQKYQISNKATTKSEREFFFQKITQQHKQQQQTSTEKREKLNKTKQITTYHLIRMYSRRFT